MDWARELRDIPLVLVVLAMCAVFILAVRRWPTGGTASAKSNASVAPAAGGWTIGDGASGPYIGRPDDAGCAGDGGSNVGGGDGSGSGDGGGGGGE